jgi:site-specific recombinase XerD
MPRLSAPANKGQKLPPEPLTAVEVQRLLATCSLRSLTGARNRALIALLYRSGLRVSEALALTPKDLDAKAGTVRILHGKGDRSRVVGLDAGAWAILELWLQRRRSEGLTGRQTVFCTLDGQPLKAAYVRAVLPRLGRKAGIEKRVHAHGLRHTHAFELAGEGVPLHVIQAQLGHTSVATTDRYIRHLNPTAVIEAVKRREWAL